MAAKQLAYAGEARSSLKEGVDAVATAVKVTLGPRAATSFSSGSTGRR